MSDFIAVREIQRARVARSCSECDAIIEVGEPCREYSGRHEDRFFRMRMHADCDEAAEHYRQEIRWFGGDDWRGLFVECLESGETEAILPMLREWPAVVRRLEKYA